MTPLHPKLFKGVVYDIPKSFHSDSGLYQRARRLCLRYGKPYAEARRLLLQETAAAYPEVTA